MLLKRILTKGLPFIFLMLTLFSVNCSPGQPNFGMVFTAKLDGNQDIYNISSSDFSRLERLTFTSVDREKNLQVTKDGMKILFYVPQPDSDRISAESLTPPATYAHAYILDRKLKLLIEVNDTLGLSPVIPLTWSTNHEQAVLLETATRKIYAANIEKKKIQELNIPISEGAYLSEVAYSPNGKQVAYVEDSSSSGVFSLVTKKSFVFDIETKLITPLGNELADCNNPRWSPVEKKISLLCNLSTDGADPDYYIYILDVLDGNTVKKLAAFSQCHASVWAPDGKRVVMACIRDGRRALYLADSDGNNYKEIKRVPDSDTPHIWEIAWTPDGGQILYIAGESQDHSNIYVVNIDGTNNHSITVQPANYSELFVYTVEP